MDQMQKGETEEKLVQLPQQITQILHTKIVQEKNLSINEALIRFKQLNSQYLIQTSTDLLCERDHKDKFGNKNKKVDNFSIMTKLRHLENAALQSRADHEIGERQKKKNMSPNKSARKKRKWLKCENTLNQPYLKTYSNFIKSQKEGQDILMKHYMQGNQTPDLQSESSISQDDQPFRKWLNFSKQLKPYRKIVQYTKLKVQMKNSFRNQCPIQTKKAEILQELRSAHKYQSYKQYSQVQKKIVTSAESKTQIDKQILTKQLIDRKMSRIYKKPSKSQSNSYEKNIQRNKLDSSYLQITPLKKRPLKQKIQMPRTQILYKKYKVQNELTNQKFSKSLDLKKFK